MTKLLKLIVTSAAIGITIGYLVALSFSSLYQTRYFVPSAPTYVATFSSPLSATLISTGLWAIIGIVFGLASLTFQQSNWSITHQTVVNFCLTYLGFTPLAVLCGWFPLNFHWLLSFTGIFILIYAILWLNYYLASYHEVQRLNRLLKK